MTVILIIIAILALIVIGLIVAPVGHAIRTQPRRLRAGRPMTSAARGERPFRRPR
jgi:hypothetical protein